MQISLSSYLLFYHTCLSLSITLKAPGGQGPCPISSTALYVGHTGGTPMFNELIVVVFIGHMLDATQRAGQLRG